MNFVTVELHTGAYLRYLTIYPDVKESLALQLFEQLAVMPFPSSYYGRKDGRFLIEKIVLNQPHYLLFGVPHHFFTGVVRIGN